MCEAKLQTSVLLMLF